MFASTVNLLLASAGSRGADVLRALLQPAGSSLMSKFVKTRTDVAQEWIRANPQDRSSVTLLSASELDAIYGPDIVSRLSSQLDIDKTEVVRLLNGTLYTGARLVAPDGERVSDRAARRLDEELKTAIL